MNADLSARGINSPGHGARDNSSPIKTERISKGIKTDSITRKGWVKNVPGDRIIPLKANASRMWENSRINEGMNRNVTPRGKRIMVGVLILAMVLNRRVVSTVLYKNKIMRTWAELEDQKHNTYTGKCPGACYPVV